MAHIEFTMPIEDEHGNNKGTFTCIAPSWIEMCEEAFQWSLQHPGYYPDTLNTKRRKVEIEPIGDVSTQWTQEAQ